MSRLEVAKVWYDRQIVRLTAVDTWVRAGKKLPAEETLPAVVAEYTPLAKKLAFEKLKAEREDIQRVALIRLFAGFEADFRQAFATALVRHRKELDVEQVRDALPQSIDLVTNLARSFEPRFTGEDKGWLDGLRGFRNKLMHQGFEEMEVPTRYEPVQVYTKLRGILTVF